MSSSRDESRDTHNPRTNGWECPWHPLQVLAWIVVVFFALSHYGFLVFYFPSFWRIIGYVAPGILFIIYLISTVITTSIDSSDPNLIAKFKGETRRTRGRFDPRVHGHVIENLHCHLCNVNVHTSTKHCRLCDKCVYGFDHHCKWLNTCIGTRNYKWFIVSITTALISTLLNLILTIILFILFFAKRDFVRYFCDDTPFNITSCDSELRVFGAPIPDPVFPTLDGFIGVLSCVSFVLLLHLTLFHYYLIYKGISTYDYIMRQRPPPSPPQEQEDREERRRMRRRRERNEQDNCCYISRKNRILPTSSLLEEQEVKQEEEEYFKESTTDSTSTTSSNNSASKMTFGRTPPTSDNEETVDFTISQNEEYVSLEATPTLSLEATPMYSPALQVHVSTELQNVIVSETTPLTTPILEPSLQVHVNNKDLSKNEQTVLNSSSLINSGRVLLPPISTHSNNETEIFMSNLLTNNNNNNNT